jgi:probable addiction module antidote protein
VRDRPHDDAIAEEFRRDPAYAAALLDNILEDGDQGELLIVLRQMTKAFGGVPKVAERAGLNRTQLYRTLSAQGNPEVRSLVAVLDAMGLRLAIRPVRKTAERRARAR